MDMPTVSIKALKRDLPKRYRDLAPYRDTGIASVFQAADSATGRVVDIKLPSPQAISADPQKVQARFRNEIDISAAFYHPNIIPLYDASDQKAHTLFLVTPHVDIDAFLSSRMSLADVITLEETIRVARAVAAALSHSHANDVLHCDVKPDNIAVFSTHVAILDFAVARSSSLGFDEYIEEGMTVGTPYYMSPEQARAYKLDGRSDLYSLGAVMYHCLTGSVPFDGEDSFAIGYKHIMEELPTPPLESRKHQQLFMIIKRLMAKDPNDRFQSAGDLLKALPSPPTATPVGHRNAANTGLEPYTGDGDFFFGCYLREDFERVLPFMHRITDLGYNLWYDKGIPAGAEWDAIIEARIKRCAGVVLFLTLGSIESKHIRREVKYADKEEKPIVTIKLDDVELAHGLDMLLTQYQVLDSSDTDPVQLARSLGFVHQRREPVQVHPAQFPL